MRFISLLTIAILAATFPALARDPMVKDGKFTICAFRTFDKCELFTGKAIKKFRLTAEEKQKLKELQRYAAATQAIPLADLEKSFGRLPKFFPYDNPNKKTLAWYRDSVGLNDLTAKCPECGIYISLIDDMPIDIFYIVDEKFRLVWYRAAKP